MPIQARKVIDSLPQYKPGDSIESIQKKTGIKKLEKVASNENPLGCPLTECSPLLVNAHVYPDQNHHPLYKYLCKKHKIDSNQLLLGNGSDECLLLTALAYLNPTDTVLSASHTFSVYKSVTELMGAAYKTVEMQNWSYDCKKLAEKITDNCKIIFIANPNNPTGSLIPHSEIKDFLSKIPPHVLVVLDEAYREYVSSETLDQNIDLIKKHPNLLITRTFSKAFGLAGFRLGYAIGSTEVIGTLQQTRPPFNVSQLALHAAYEVLTKHGDFLEKSLTINESGKQAYYKAAKNWPVTCLPTEGNFVCILLKQESSDSVYQHLLKNGYIIRKCDSFGIANAVRITISYEEINNGIITALNNLFKSK